MKLYEPYLYSEDEKFLNDTMVNAIIAGELESLEDFNANEEILITIPTGEKHSNDYRQQCRNLECILTTLNIFVPSASGLGTFLDGERIALVEPLISFEEDHGKDIRSPWLSR